MANRKAPISPFMTWLFFDNQANVNTVHLTKSRRIGSGGREGTSTRCRQPVSPDSVNTSAVTRESTPIWLFPRSGSVASNVVREDCQPVDDSRFPGADRALQRCDFMPKQETCISRQLGLGHESSTTVRAARPLAAPDPRSSDHNKTVTSGTNWQRCC